MLFLETLGVLFDDVQVNKIFPDQKTFADCRPKYPIKHILKAYEEQKNEPEFSLKGFVYNHFDLEEEIHTAVPTNETNDINKHITGLWDKLTRTAQESGNTLIPLPERYIVPGGRFRELFYWDSYFTMLGLQESGRWDLIESLTENFAYLIRQFGHIPNGNRTYLLSRSQPPYFSMMVQMMASKEERYLQKYLDALEREYAFWMDGSESLSVEVQANKRVVWLEGDMILNRYWDEKDTPRPEGYLPDVESVTTSGLRPQQLYRNIRAACESGWDFSGRWFRNGKDFNTIATTEILPVDLNCLLWNLEQTLYLGHVKSGDTDRSQKYQSLAERRKKAILAIFWDKRNDAFCDYNYLDGSSTGSLNIGMVYPLCFHLADNAQAEKIAKHIENDFLKPGGILTTLNKTGQQWDAPNGWAPLQWMAFTAMQNYGYDKLSGTIAERWTSMVETVYRLTGKIMEKYNVEDTGYTAGGGEYPNQDGFGWTNGVYLKMKSVLTT